MLPEVISQLSNAILCNLCHFRQPARSAKGNKTLCYDLFVVVTSPSSKLACMH